MNISKIGSTAFKGFLEIRHQNGTNCFNTKNINKIRLNNDQNSVIIEGEDTSGKKTSVLIPSYAMSQDKVIAAYKAAKDISENGVLILKINNKCHAKSE